VRADCPGERLKITGTATRYVRSTEAGGAVETVFRPTCGSTVYARADKHPARLGVAVGAIADAGFPVPVRLVSEQAKHAWVSIPGPAEHFLQGRP